MQKINFNDRYGLTQAVIEGRKTMTRRLEFDDELQQMVTDSDSYYYDDGYLVFATQGVDIHHVKTRYKVGEVVAVAQRYSAIAAGHPDVDTFLLQVAKAHKISLESVQDLAGWNNKMFTKAELMPHQIRITGIKCEGLQDIQDADCLKEGVRYIPEINKFYFEDVRREEGFYFDNHREAFAALIDKVSGRGTWGLNPWVVVYEFELVK